MENRKLEAIKNIVFSHLEEHKGGMSNHKEFFGFYLRIVRQQKNLSRQDLSGQTSIDIPTLVALENNMLSYEILSAKEIDQITQALGISVIEFAQRVGGLINVIDDVLSSSQDELPTMANEI